MDTDAARRDTELFMRAPLVRYGFAECDHLLDDSRLALEFGLLRAPCLMGLVMDGLDHEAAVFRQNTDGVGGQELVIKRSRDRTGAGLVPSSPACTSYSVAAGFEAVDCTA